MSFPALCAAQPELFAQAARRWELFGTGLDRRHSELLRLIGSVGSGWEGAARDAAIGYLRGIAERLEGDLALVGRIPPVLIEHAAEVGAAQRLLRGAVAATRGSSIVVGPDGSVGIPPVVATELVSLVGPAGLAVLFVQAEVIAFAVRYALRIATESDAQTASLLGELVPGFGRWGPVGSVSARIPAAGTSPQRVHEWWNRLGPAAQYGLIHADPQAIGDLDGVPAEARDQANRLVLAGLPDYRSRITELDGVGARRSEAESTELARLRGIQILRDRLSGDDPQPAYLLGFDPSGHGKAIVAVGNPDTAANVVTYVPGTGSGFRSVPTDLGRTGLMVKEANALDPGAATSVVMWIGYDAPQDIATFPPGRGDAIDPGLAARGAPVLDSFQDGLRATHDGPPSHNTVLGHSYGSTVVGHAAKDHGLAVDDVIFAAEAHSQYWDKGSSSLKNMIAIITDQDEKVSMA